MLVTTFLTSCGTGADTDLRFPALACPFPPHLDSSVVQSFRFYLSVSGSAGEGAFLSTLVLSTEALSWGWEARWKGGWVIVRPIKREQEGPW